MKILLFIFSYFTIPFIFPIKAQDPSQNCPANELLKTICYISLAYEAEHWNSLSAEVIDFYLCTHYVAGFAYIDYAGGKKPRINFPENASKGGRRFLMSLIEASKQRNNLQFLISIGGGNDLNYKDKYCQLINKDPTEFLGQLTKLLDETGVDGFDFFWNWLGRHSPIENELNCLQKMVTLLCKFLQQLGKICMVTLRGVEKLNLDNPPIKAVQLIQQIIKKADLVNIWTSDLLETTSDSILVQPQDFLEVNFTEGSMTPQKNVNNLVKFYIEISNSSRPILKKLSMIIPFHSRAYGIERSNEIDAPPPLVGQKDLTTSFHPIRADYRFMFPFFRTCAELVGQKKEKLFYYEYPQLNGLAVAYNRNYDNDRDGVAMFFPTKQSVGAKATFAREAGLGGVVVFQMGADDVHGWCYNQSYPLIHEINKSLKNCRFH